MWQPDPVGTADVFDTARRTAAALAAFTGGRPGMFTPRHLYGPWWNPFGIDEPSSLYDTRPLAATLEQLVDFDALNGGTIRYSATAIDVETGEDVVFDNRAHRLTPNHIRASSALLPAFAPVEIDGRLFADAGISANLPLDIVLAEASDRPLLCIAIDLLPLRAAAPRTLGETLSRAQDLMFASQSRRSIAAWQAIHDARVEAGSARRVELLYLAYADQAQEVSGKAFDFSPGSAAQRWESGRRDLTAALAALGPDAPFADRPGLNVRTLTAGQLTPLRWSLKPTPV